jgi:uncharacterized protein YjbI with pentapeptide repeats
MANSKHLKKLRGTVEAWNHWREAQDINLDLSEADLRGIKLRAKRFRGLSPRGLERLLGGEEPPSGARLSGADLSGINFSGANLCESDLTGANLARTNLTGAHMRSADLYGAKLPYAKLERTDLSEADLASTDLNYTVLREANLRKTDLRGADLGSADLLGADLSYAGIGETRFVDNDLSTVKGLETVYHQGPSAIDIKTIYRSGGKIPLVFLRGAGVPENLITFIHSLAASDAVHYHTCFISYSSKDQEFADRLYGDLQNKGVRCWFAPHDVQAGKKLHEQIDEAILRFERLLLILSANSMTSEWVKTEIRKARRREHTEKKRVLFPVRLVSFDAIRDWELFDADEGKDLAIEIREFYIPDFSQWKSQDPYQEEFGKLLRDLRTDKPYDP